MYPMQMMNDIIRNDAVSPWKVIFQTAALLFSDSLLNFDEETSIMENKHKISTGLQIQPG